MTPAASLDTEPGTARSTGFFDRVRPLAETYAQSLPVRRVAVVGNQPLAPSAERAAAIDSAVATAIAAGLRTGDIFTPEDPNAKKATTTQMGDSIAAAI